TPLIGNGISAIFPARYQTLSNPWLLRRRANFLPIGKTATHHGVRTKARIGRLENPIGRDIPETHEFVERTQFMSYRRCNCMAKIARKFRKTSFMMQNSQAFDGLSEQP